MGEPVTIDLLKAWARSVPEHPLRYPILADGARDAKIWYERVTTSPFTVFLDRNMIIRYHEFGFNEPDTPILFIQHIEELIHE